MTRVLFLAESFHPVLGGGEGHIRTLGRLLAGGGDEVTVVTRHGERTWLAEETLDGIRVRRVGPTGPARRGKYLMVPAALVALWRQRGHHDVLVVRGTRVLGLPGFLAGRALGKAVVLQPEVNGEFSGEVYTWGNRLGRPPWRQVVRGATAARNLALGRADAFVAMSRAIEAEMLAAGLPRERVEYLPHGVDTGRFRPAAPTERRELRRRLGLPPDGLLVVYTGRLLRGKGLETLLEAFARLRGAFPTCTLAIVGSGEGQALSVEAALHEQADRLGLGSAVVFTGRVEAVEDHLRAGDVFAFPSVFEALGLSLLEAAACGLPCVGTRTGGIVDVVEEGGSGLLVEPHDVEDLARALTTLAAEPGLRERMGDRGRAVVRERFDLASSLERYRALFAAVVSRRPRG